MEAVRSFAFAKCSCGVSGAGMSRRRGLRVGSRRDVCRACGDAVG